MSLMAILASYNATIQGNNARYGMMQNNQNRMSMARNAGPNFAGNAQLARADKSAEMNNAQLGLQAKVADVQLDSMEKARDKWAQSFNYFA